VTKSALPTFKIALLGKTGSPSFIFCLLVVTDAELEGPESPL
jgi:hypothetical protein